MNGQTTTVIEHNHPHICGLKCISWTAIFSGAFVGVGLSFLLNLLCIGIGLSAFTATQEGSMVLAVSGFIGLVIAAFISMFMGGWVAGYLGRPYCSRRHLGELYGFITWSVALVLTILLAANASKFVSNFNDSVLMHSNTSMVNVTINDAAPLVSQKTRTNPSTGNTVTHTTVNAEKATNALGVTAFVTFFLFFIGALASCFGGCLAMRCKKSYVNTANCPICK